MKTRFNKRRVIEDYVFTNPAIRSDLTIWLARAKYADWNTPADIKRKFRSAVIDEQNGRVVFNIGKKYRLICNYKFREKNTCLTIKWIGTREEYETLVNEPIAPSKRLLIDIKVFSQGPDAVLR